MKKKLLILTLMVVVLINLPLSFATIETDLPIIFESTEPSDEQDNGYEEAAELIPVVIEIE